MIKDFGKIAIIAGERQVSYTEMLKRINMFALRTPQQPGLKTIIFSENREGWIYAFFSVWQNRGIAVPVDASSTVSDLEYILRDCEPACLWVSQSRLQTARDAVAAAQSDARIELIEDLETVPCTVDSVQEWGQDTQPQDTAVIIYTSGTTGSPKGVMLSYANLQANARGVSDEVPIFDSERRTMILLPVHHVLPLQGTVIVPLMRGGGVAICPSMTGPDIMDTLCRGKIAIFIGVPRLWQTLYSGIKKKIDASPVTRALFWICQKAGSRTLSRFVFQSIRKKMGGHLDFCVSGGAALDREIGVGLKTLGLDVLEGYGMTETAPIIAFTRPGDIIPGCVGLPLPSVECKIVNGELCAKGPNVMQGYYNRPQETADVIDQDGFIHTGDLARIDEAGRVYITGRCKEIIVLSNGKNVQPSEIEFQLEKFASYVKEAAIVQDGDMLRAIIVPQPTWAQGQTDAQIQEVLKRDVLNPYNLTVENYKKVMRLMVYHGDLPRTKLDKLQRFKLKDLLNNPTPSQTEQASVPEPDMEEYRILRDYIHAEKKIAVKPTEHLETDLAFDSLDRVGLQGFIENTFGMDIDADALISFANVQAIAQHIAAEKTRMEVTEIDWNHILTSQNVTLKLPTSSPLLPVHAGLFHRFFRLHNNLQILGTENIPAKGPYIIAPNHQSYIDGPLAVSGLTWKARRHSYFYATENHVRGRILRFMAQRNNIIVMERKNLKNSILKLAEVLNLGKNIVIFPEGTRTRDGKIAEFKKTFAILSKELNVPILPVCISGAFDAMPRGTHRLGTNDIHVHYLPVVMPTADDTYQTLSDRVREHIQECLKK